MATAAAATATYRAVVLGATGAVGSALMRTLLGSPRCSAVLSVGRRHTDAFAAEPDAAAKLTQQVVADLGQLAREILQVPPSSAAAAAEPLIAFCTLGVGQPSKVSKEELHRVDVEYSSAFAQACRQAGVEHISLLTAVNTSADSSLYYSRVKAEVESNYAQLGFPRCSFFRPSLIATPEARYGMSDRVIQAVFPKLSWMFPSRYHEIHVEQLGRAFCYNAEQQLGSGSRAPEVLEYRDFIRVLQAADTAASAATTAS